MSGNRETWIGATDQAVEGVWMDSRGRPVTYTDWWSYEISSGSFSEPDNQGGNQDCVSVDHLPIGILEGSWYHGYRWRDQECYDKLICYACQKGNGIYMAKTIFDQKNFRQSKKNFEIFPALHFYCPFSFLIVQKLLIFPESFVPHTVQHFR